MSIRVVLVDDVEDYRRLVRVALRLRGGFEVVAEAANGREAVEAVIEHRPDVVVLDLGLPDLPGSEVIARIRHASPSSGVVVFTGTELDPSHELRRQVEGYVVKDLDLELLGATLTVVGGRRHRTTSLLRLSRDLRSSAQARRFVEDQCSRWHCEQLSDSAQLVVTELVTNAITHASSDCELRMFLLESLLRIEVEDGGTGDPAMGRPGDQESEHGRGLLLISALSTAWGVEPVSPAGKKRVWAHLALAETHAA
ncbi:MAG: response regulator [Actinomycetota bacterium]|nr:response regulator [Actinomycetota bacterium]